MAVEPTDVEFKAVEGQQPPYPEICVHCGLVLGWHWQTAEGKILCTREVKP